MNAYESLRTKLLNDKKSWLITGVAGFIGSNLLEALLKLNQRIVGLDNLSTGYDHNLTEVRKVVSEQQWSNFKFIRGDIRDIVDCRSACDSVNYVLHQAALGSVPRSIEDPVATNENNIDGFLNMIVAASDANVSRFIYAGSSSTYGDQVDLPKVEEKIGKPLSPYAVTKLVNEIYADVFARTYGFKSIGLRYFNVFGPRQDADGAYAAVIPRWIGAMIRGEAVYINGDGESSRDFCYIENVVQANLLAAMTDDASAINQVFNIAVGERTSLNDLYYHLRDNLAEYFPNLHGKSPIYRDFRPGDVRHSLANIDKAKSLLRYEPTHRIADGLKEAMRWYIDFNADQRRR